MGGSQTEAGFTGYQKLVVILMAFLQFSIILDFTVMSPLGAMLMPALQITPSQFGLVVSAYAFSAGISAILVAGFADRFDRKCLLLFFYAGFILGTFLCAIAPTFQFLLFSRIITGMFGGVIGSVVLAIITDRFSLQMRGRVMGVVQTAFAASQILVAVGPLVGRASDTWGKFNVFLFGATLTMIMVLIYTNLGTTPLPWVLAVNVLLFVGIFARMIPTRP
jgi:predicted MFS family arabinose efflux permease